MGVAVGVLALVLATVGGIEVSHRAGRLLGRNGLAEEKRRGAGDATRKASKYKRRPKS